MTDPEEDRPSWQGSPEHLAMEAEVEATVVRRYSHAVQRLLDAVGAADADAVRRAHAQAQLALARRITTLAESAEVEDLQRLVDAYLTLPKPSEDWPDV